MSGGGGLKHMAPVAWAHARSVKTKQGAVNLFVPPDINSHFIEPAGLRLKDSVTSAYADQGPVLHYTSIGQGVQK